MVWTMGFGVVEAYRRVPRVKMIVKKFRSGNLAFYGQQKVHVKWFSGVHERRGQRDFNDTPTSRSERQNFGSSCGVVCVVPTAE